MIQLLLPRDESDNANLYHRILLNINSLNQSTIITFKKAKLIFIVDWE